MKHTLKTLTVAATLVLPALAGCSGEDQQANPPPNNAAAPAVTPGASEPANRPADAPTGDQPKIIDKPAAPTATPDAKPKEEEAPKGA